ncbi:hypothetical protein Tco_1260647 [Tanacetum coccineum]
MTDRSHLQSVSRKLVPVDVSKTTAGPIELVKLLIQNQDEMIKAGSTEDDVVNLQFHLSDTFTEPLSFVEPTEITKPFQHDPAKQQHFEKYMKEKYQGGLLTKDVGGSSKMSEAARARERLEFEAAVEAVTHGKWGKESQSFSEQILGASTAKSSDRSSLLRGDSSQLPFQADQRLHAKTHADRKPVQESNAYKHDQSNPSSKGKQNPPARKIAGKATRTNPVSAPSKDALEHTKARLDVKVNNGCGPFCGATMTEAIQRGYVLSH